MLILSYGMRWSNCRLTSGYDKIPKCGKQGHPGIPQVSVNLTDNPCKVGIRSHLPLHQLIIRLKSEYYNVNGKSLMFYNFAKICNKR